MPAAAIIEDAEQRMDKAIEVLKKSLSGIRTGRANPGLVDSLRVDVYGSPTPIKQVAQVGAPEPTQIVIRPYDTGIIKEIENVDSQGNREVAMDKYFKRVTTEVAPPEFINGITTLATGKAKHLSSPKWGYFAVRKWSFNSQAEALKPIDAEAGNSNNTSSTPASSSTMESEEADF